MGLGRDFKIVRTVERLNNIIHVSTLTSRFVSMFYGELELTGGVVGVNAGHPPPFHLAADGTVTFFDAGGPVLGPLPDASYDRSFKEMRPGDLLVMYTDGLTETLEGSKDSVEVPSWEGEEYGVERLVEVARKNQGQKAEEVIHAIFQSIKEWSGNAPAQDDCTVVVVVYPQALAKAPALS
jgi:sigma-B regulation protein RsbU (phosphoserine phosphatase)